MRIAYISGSYPPMISGVSNMLQSLSVGMSERGHAVLVISASDKKEPYAFQSGNLQIVRLRSYLNPLQAGGRFMIWPKEAITLQLRAFSPDLIHLHDLFHISLAGMLSGKLIGVPILYTVHQLPWIVSTYIRASGGLKRRIEDGIWVYGRWFVHKCDAVISPAATIADHMIEQINCHPQVISNGIDTLRFSPVPAYPEENAKIRKKYGLNPNSPVILYVGRISREKQVKASIQAAARAIHAMNAQLLVVGDGPERKAMISLARELGIQDRAHFPGLVPHDVDLPAIYRLASVFLTASNIEIQPMVVLEAIASGLPVVATQASSIPELVKDGLSGYLVPPGEVDTMTDRLLLILKQREQAREMGRAARALAEKHSIANTIDAHERLYQSTLVKITSRVV